MSERRSASKPRTELKRGEVKAMLATPMAAQAVLDREFLEVRAKLIELAASFDRLDRGGGAPADDSRVKLIKQSLKALLEETGDRAEQLQLIFSRPYDDDWQKEFGFAAPPPEPTEE